MSGISAGSVIITTARTVPAMRGAISASSGAKLVSANTTQSCAWPMM